MELKRAISHDELINKKFVTMTFTDKWASSFGEIVDRSGMWIIYGESGHGKTEFALQLAQYLTTFGKVLYDTLEEGARRSFQNALKRQCFGPSERRRFNLVSESIDELRFRLKKQKAAKIVFIDSLQHSQINKKQFLALKNDFPTTLFIWICHAEGKKPVGAFARWVEFDCDVKIRVEGFLAMFKSRFEGFQDLIINQERYDSYYNEIA